MLRLPSVRWVFAFLAFSCASLAWSSTVSLSASAGYWCGIAADVAIVVLLFRSGSAIVVAHSLMKGFIWSTCLLALVAWIMPLQKDLRLGNEQFFNANQIGNLCAFTIFFVQYLTRRKDGKWGWVALLLSLTLLRSLSKTTIFAFLLSQSFLLIQDRAMTRKAKLLLTTGALFAVLAFWGLLETYYDLYTRAGNQAETLTGRTGIWAYCMSAGIEQPWIGHGFDSLWKIIPPFGIDQFEARHAENELLQQFYAYGVTGIVLLTGLYGSLFWKIRGSARGPARVVLLSFLLFIVVRGFAEAEPFDLLLPLWAIVLVSMIVDSESHGWGREPATAPPYARSDLSLSQRTPDLSRIDGSTQMER
jgi:O-antigen ligase